MKPCAVLVIAVVLTGVSSASVINPFSTSEIITDGQFTGSVNGQIQPNGEWSGVTPLAFDATATQLTPTSLDDPFANSFLYAVVSQGVEGPSELYMMMEYFGRTQSFADGATVATVDLPILINGISTPVIIQLFGDNSLSVIDQNDDSLVTGFDIDAAYGFGQSPESTASHLLIEVEIPLSVAITGGSGFAVMATATADEPDPPISSSIFEIDPNSLSTTISPVLATPEPASFTLVAIGLLLAAGSFLRRR
jgi:hypothetical protein